VTGRWDALIFIYMAITGTWAVVMENSAQQCFHGLQSVVMQAALSYRGKWRDAVGEECKSCLAFKNSFPNSNLGIAAQRRHSARPAWFGCMVGALVALGAYCRGRRATIPSWPCVLGLRLRRWWKLLSEQHWCLPPGAGVKLPIE